MVLNNMWQRLRHQSARIHSDRTPILVEGSSTLWLAVLYLEMLVKLCPLYFVVLRKGL